MWYNIVLWTLVWFMQGTLCAMAGYQLNILSAAESFSSDFLQVSRDINYIAPYEKSVVDTDLKIHGVDNGFILSTSVFPSSATANPTFTLLCLVFRFSMHFKKILGTKENSFEIK